MKTSGNATGMAQRDRGGKDRVGPLEEFEGDRRERLKKAVRDQETIVVSGGGWENIELLDILAKSIPENHKVIELEPRFDVGLGKDVRDAFPDHVVLVYENSLAEIAAAASNMAGDYLIVPNMRLRDIGVFQRDIAHDFKGGIIVGIVDGIIPEIDKEVCSIADVLIRTIPRRKASLGIGAVWARPGRDPLEAIPAQDAGPHFAISTAGQISQESALTLDGNDIQSPELPDEAALPQQSPRAAIFTEAEGGVIGIAPPTPQDRLANTPEVLDFYKEVREQAGYLADLGPNMLGQRLHQAAARFQQCFPGSFEEAIERRVWSRGNALRVILSEHNAIASDPTHPHRLEPSVAETMRGLVELFNQLAFADPSLRSRDARRPGPQEVNRASAGLRIAVEFIPVVAVDRAITNSEAGAELSEQIEIAQQLDAVADDGLPSKFAEEHAAETFGNFVSHVILSLRNAAVYVTKEVTSGGLRAAGATIFVSVSPAIVSWFIANSDQILAFCAIVFEHIPASRQTVEWLRAHITDDGRSD
jgi:hypothetical protein